MNCHFPVEQVETQAQCFWSSVLKTKFPTVLGKKED